MFNKSNSKTVNQCQLVISEACKKAMRVCVTYNAVHDRNMFVTVEAEMLQRLAKVYNVNLSAKAARAAAEKDVPDFRVYDLHTLATLEDGKVLYGLAKYALMKRLGTEAMASFVAKAA